MLVDEPSVEDTIAILRGLKERYELHHGVDITDPAIIAAATLSHRYIADRQLPDKAIDLMDEAASLIRMEIDSMPEEMDRMERRLIQLKIEREALKKESDTASRKRRADLEAAIGKLQREFSDLEDVWKSEKAALQAPSTSKRSWNGHAWSWRRPVGRGISPVCPSYSTAVFPSWKNSWRRRPWRKTRRCSCCATRSVTRRLPKWSPAGPASPSENAGG